MYLLVIDKNAEALERYFSSYRAEVDRSVREALGLKDGQPMPVVGGEFPKMLYFADYFTATTDEDRAANTRVVETADEEASAVSDGWHASLSKAKTAAEASGDLKPTTKGRKK